MQISYSYTQSVRFVISSELLMCSGEKKPVERKPVLLL